MGSVWNSKFKKRVEKQRDIIEEKQQAYDEAVWEQQHILKEYKECLPVKEGDEVMCSMYYRRAIPREASINFVEVKEDGSWRVKSVKRDAGRINDTHCIAVYDLRSYDTIIKDGVKYKGWQKPV